MLSETFDNGWHARIDGKKVAIEQAYGVIRAIPVAAGDHSITLTYDPWSLRYGFYLSLVGAAISLTVVAAYILGRLRSAPQEEQQPA